MAESVSSGHPGPGRVSIVGRAALPPLRLKEAQILREKRLGASIEIQRIYRGLRGRRASGSSKLKGRESRCGGSGRVRRSDVA